MISHWERPIGNVKSIIKTKQHPHKKIVVDSIRNMMPHSILEIGAGELYEAELIRKIHPDIEYSICDISKSYLLYAYKKGFKNLYLCSMGCLDKLIKERRYDIVYACHVLEHSPNIKEAISIISKISNKFLFVMFKWKNSGGLGSCFNKTKNYYSTEFNLKKLIKYIKLYGIIKERFIVNTKGKILELDTNKNYERGNHLILKGEWYDSSLQDS